MSQTNFKKFMVEPYSNSMGGMKSSMSISQTRTSSGLNINTNRQYRLRKTSSNSDYNQQSVRINDSTYESNSRRIMLSASTKDRKESIPEVPKRVHLKKRPKEKLSDNAYLNQVQ